MNRILCECLTLSLIGLLVIVGACEWAEWVFRGMPELPAERDPERDEFDRLDAEDREWLDRWTRNGRAA